MTGKATKDHYDEFVYAVDELDEDAPADGAASPQDNARVAAPVQQRWEAASRDRQQMPDACWWLGYR